MRFLIPVIYNISDHEIRNKYVPSPSRSLLFVKTVCP